ncbi:hypothetical protein Tco_1417219 [Tanacetum coccineum]
MGSLLPAEGVPLRYAQLYFFDIQHEIMNRMSAFMEKKTSDKVEESTVTRLIQMLDRSNALSKSFRMAKEWCRSHHSQDFSLRLLSERTSSRQYNAPTMSEVTALIVNDFGELTDILPSLFSFVCDRVPKTGTTPHTYPLMVGGTLQVRDT